MTVKLRNVLIVAVLALSLGASAVAPAGIIDKAAEKLQQKSSGKKGGTKSSSSASLPRYSSQPSSTSSTRNDGARGSDGDSRGSSAGSGSSTGSHSSSGNSRNVFGGLAGATDSGGRDSRDSRAGDRGGSDRTPDSRDRGGSRQLNDDLDRLQGRDPDRDRHGGHDHDRRPQHVVDHLPRGYRDYYWHGDRYYVYGGRWYRPYGVSYIPVGAPYGLFVTTLPGPYTSFWYDYDSTYYVYEPVQRGYVVSRSPYGEDFEDRSGDDLYVYPAAGQSEQQLADDRYECHRWAVDQTGYNPLDDDYDVDLRADYLRAMTACLTGRGYTVN
jgi:hypothetical protein